jgi:hypothetical protein
MRDRVASPAAGEARRRHVAKAVVGKVEAGVLAGRIKVKRDARALQLEHDRRELDSFGSGSDDETNANRLQLSPWLRRRQCDRSKPALQPI